MAAKKLQPRAVYRLLDTQLIILISLLGLVAIYLKYKEQNIWLVVTSSIIVILGLFKHRISTLKGQAAAAEENERVLNSKWTDYHPGVADIRILVYDESVFYDFLAGYIDIQVLEGGAGIKDGKVGISTTESPIYFPEGLYRLKFDSSEFTSEPFDVRISLQDVGQRKSYQIQLKKKVDG